MVPFNLGDTLEIRSLFKHYIVVGQVVGIILRGELPSDELSRIVYQNSPSRVFNPCNVDRMVIRKPTGYHVLIPCSKEYKFTKKGAHNEDI